MKHINLLMMTWVIFFSFHFVDTAKATLDNPLTTVELDTPVHFLAPDGSDLRVEAGTYAIEPAEEWIRLMSGDRHDALLIEAAKGTHEMELEHTMGLSIPGETEEEKDFHYVMLMLPNGQSLEATGTYSGVRPRGFFNQAFKTVKTRVKRAYKKSRSLSNKGPDQLTAEFLKLNSQDPNKNPTTHNQLQKQAANLRKHSQGLARKHAPHAQAKRKAAKARKQLHDIKRKIEKNARQAWRKTRQMYRNAKKRAGSAISVTKTPAPGGPIPIPYPNISNPKGKKRTGKSN